MGDLCRLAYVSRAPAVTEAHLADILEVSNRRNRQLRLGGFLILMQGCFFQVLEGDSTRVAEVMASIHRDTRHNDVTVVYDRSVSHRAFGQWGMVSLASRPRVFASVMGWPAATAMNREADPDEGGFDAFAPDRWADPGFAEKMIAAGALIHDLTTARGNEVAADSAGLCDLTRAMTGRPVVDTLAAE